MHDYPDNLYWEVIEVPTEDLKSKDSYYSFHLPDEVNRVKGVTAIILKETPDEKELPEIEKREGKNWIGLRIRNKGKITDIYINQLADGRLMHSNSWIEADGWSTDAYMFIVTYPEKSAPADAKEYFIGYGSSLKEELPLISPRWQNYLLFRKKKIDACSYGLMAPPKSKPISEVYNARYLCLLMGKVFP